MEDIHFEAQLCNKILIFKEISNVDILIILCLGTGLQHMCLSPSLSFWKATRMLGAQLVQLVKHDSSFLTAL